MARTLDQIIAELSPTFTAQTNSLQAQQQLIPGQIASQEEALNAKKDVAYEDIVSGARRRGLGFSGIPLGEQAKYAATDYAPALAGLRQQGQQKAMSLQDAILGVNERRDTLGQGIYQTEQDREFQTVQAEKNRQAQEAAQLRAERASAASARAAAFSPSQYSPGGGGQAPQARAVQSKPGSFAFYDAGNKPITAALYAKSTGQNLNNLLYTMGNNGDKTAARVYNELYAVRSKPETYARLLQGYQKTIPWLMGGA